MSSSGDGRVASDGVAATRERRGQEGTRGVCRRHAARVMMSLCLKFDCAGLPCTVWVVRRDRHLLPLAGTNGPPDLPFLPSLGVKNLSSFKRGVGSGELSASATTFSGIISSLLLAKLANHREILRSACHSKATALPAISRAKT
jgi:hypothetical protein